MERKTEVPLFSEIPRKGHGCFGKFRYFHFKLFLFYCQANFEFPGGFSVLNNFLNDFWYFRPFTFEKYPVDFRTFPERRRTNCNLKRRALHPNACSAGVSSIHSWVPLGSFLHAIIGWEIIFTAQERYRALPRSPGGYTRPVRHCPRALPAKLQFTPPLDEKCCSKKGKYGIITETAHFSPENTLGG